MNTVLVGLLLFQRLFSYSYLLSRYLFSLFSFQCYKSIVHVKRNSLVTGFPTNIHSLLLHLLLPPAQINISVSPSEPILVLSAETAGDLFQQKACCNLHSLSLAFHQLQQVSPFFPFPRCASLLFFQNFSSVFYFTCTFPSFSHPEVCSGSAPAFKSIWVFFKSHFLIVHIGLNKLPQLGSNKSNYLQIYFPRSGQRYFSHKRTYEQHLSIIHTAHYETAI